MRSQKNAKSLARIHHVHTLTNSFHEMMLYLMVALQLGRYVHFPNKGVSSELPGSATNLVAQV